MADSHAHFSPARLVEYFTTCDEHRTDIPIVEFVNGCEEIKKIVRA
jgi:hypothetical protein